MVCPTTTTKAIPPAPKYRAWARIASALLDRKTPDALACKGIKYLPAADTRGNPQYLILIKDALEIEIGIDNIFFINKLNNYLR